MNLIFSCIKDLCDSNYRKRHSDEILAKEEIEEERRRPAVPGGPSQFTYVRVETVLLDGRRKVKIYKVNPDNSLTFRFSI